MGRKSASRLRFYISSTWWGLRICAGQRRNKGLRPSVSLRTIRRKNGTLQCLLRTKINTRTSTRFFNTNDLAAKRSPRSAVRPTTNTAVHWNTRHQSERSKGISDRRRWARLTHQPVSTSKSSDIKSMSPIWFYRRLAKDVKTLNWSILTDSWRRGRLLRQTPGELRS